jgi:hypothetical protein
MPNAVFSLTMSDKLRAYLSIQDNLACAVPFSSPSGRKCFITFDLEELQKRFGS